MPVTYNSGLEEAGLRDKTDNESLLGEETEGCQKLKRAVNIKAASRTTHLPLFARQHPFQNDRFGTLEGDSLCRRFGRHGRPVQSARRLHPVWRNRGYLIPKNDKPDATEPHRGFAYIEYEDADDAKEAMDNMDQSEFFGKILKVSAAKAPKSAEEGLGSKTALWQQESWLAEHAVDEEDRTAADGAKGAIDDRPEDPMQGLEGLDVAGPKPE
ncbi:hypothetical protein PG994_001248 [Apiospora phragmitis]|uniref:RRM domain-containing protein n=1 Tax=Apiospora phragmitis TaxID=2905665 RepID=A0ABR1WSZ5_9PEZI